MNTARRTEQNKPIWSYPLARSLKWIIPVTGVSFLAAWQWTKFRRKQYNIDGEYVVTNDLAVMCYRCLPLRITSRIWGWIASREIPVSLRPTLYGFYAKTFNANLDEVGLDISSFPSLVEFFVRPLKNNARPIAQNTNLVSPADGTILYCGPVKSCNVEQVKGATYNLRHFLGDIEPDHESHVKDHTEDKECEYVKTLLTNPNNQLYQLSVYLAPGDYHRFHSPTDWEIQYRKHFKGKLLSVNPRIIKYVPDIFSLNEHVVYIGKWACGFMAYAAVGATNVGSIKVYCDRDLATNTIKWPDAKPWDDATLNCTHIKKGQEFGEFRMGSTIVLLFEAPANLKFRLSVNESVKTGEALTEKVIKQEIKSYTQVA